MTSRMDILYSWKLLPLQIHKTTHLFSILERDIGECFHLEENGEGPPKFHGANQCQPISCVQRAWVFPASSEAFPHAGLGHFLMVLKGMAWVTCVPIENILQQAHTLETLGEYIGEQEPEFLEQMPSLFVTSGCSVWIPTGFVAVTLGVDWRDDCEYLHTLSIIVLDKDATKQMSEGLRGEVASILERGVNKKIKIFDGPNKKMLSEYLLHIKPK